LLETLGFEQVQVTRRYDAFDGTSKADIARKFGVMGVSLSARLPAVVSRSAESGRTGLVGRLIGRVRALFDPPPRPPRIGEPAPSLELPTADDGEPFRVREQRGRPLLMVFLPADWCPVCHMCMRQYRAIADVFEQHQVRLVVVTPELGDHVTGFGETVGVPHRTLVDRDGHAARRFGAVYQPPAGGAPVMLPVSMLFDTEGVLRCRSELDDISLCVSRESIEAALGGQSGSAATKARQLPAA
jgi:peroxiredoxin